MGALGADEALQLAALAAVGLEMTGDTKLKQARGAGEGRAGLLRAEASEAFSNSPCLIPGLLYTQICDSELLLARGWDVSELPSWWERRRGMMSKRRSVRAQRGARAEQQGCVCESGS